MFLEGRFSHLGPNTSVLLVISVLMGGIRSRVEDIGLTGQMNRTDSCSNWPHPGKM